MALRELLAVDPVERAVQDVVGAGLREARFPARRDFEREEVVLFHEREAHPVRRPVGDRLVLGVVREAFRLRAVRRREPEVVVE